MILSNFKPKRSTFWPFFKEKLSKIHKTDDFRCKKSLKFEENSKINICSLVPQIDNPVALCQGCCHQDQTETVLVASEN